MKKRKYYIIIVFLILITSCSYNNESGNLLKKDIDKVKNTTYDDVVKKLSNIIDDFIDKHSYYTISNIEFTEDKLAIDEKNEVKKFNNIKIVLNIEVNSDQISIGLKEDITIGEKNKAFEEFVKDTNKKLLDTLHRESPIEYSKVESIKISYIDNKNKLKHNLNMENIRDAETMKSLRNEESEDEKLMLDKIFDYIREDKGNYELKRFGVDNNMLIIEFNVHESYDDVYNQKIERVSNELQELILEDDNSTRYINNQEVKSIKIIFNKIINDTEPIIFEYKIN